MISILKINRALMFLSLLAINIPLSLGIGYVRIYVWMLPFFLFLFLNIFSNRRSFVGNYEQYQRLLKSLKLIKILFFIASTSFIASTAFNSPLQENWRGLFVFIISLLFAYKYVELVAKGQIKIKQFFQFAFISFGIQVFFGILQFVTLSEIGNVKHYFGRQDITVVSGEFGEIEYSRIKGTLDQPNTVGNFIVLLFPFIIFYRYKINAVLKICTVVIGAIVLAFTLSRGSILAFVIQVLLIGLMSKFKKTMKILIVFAVLSLICILIVPQLSDLFIGMISIRFQNLAGNDSTNYRMEMITGAWEYFISNPFSPVGFGKSTGIWSEVNSQLPLQWNFRPHNIFLVFLLEGGMLAFSVLIWWFVRPITAFLMAIRRLHNYQKAIGLSLCAILIFFNIYLTALGGEVTQVIFIIIFLNFLLQYGDKNMLYEE